MADPVQIHLSAAILACAISGAVGSFLGVFFVWSLASEFLKSRLSADIAKTLHPALVDAGASLVGHARCDVSIVHADGTLLTRCAAEIHVPAINTAMVGAWLDSRDLVMAPKSRDFKVSAPKVKP